MSRKSKRNRKRVNRAERVKPSALAEAKKRPWIMQTLLHRGPEQLGTTAEQHEAAIEIVEAFTALTSASSFNVGALDGVAIIGGGFVLHELSARQLRLVTIYMGWATELLRRLHLRASIIVEWVNMDRALGCSHIPLLVRGLDLWTRQRDEWRPEQLTSPRDRVLTSPRRGMSAVDDRAQHPVPLQPGLVGQGHFPLASLAAQHLTAPPALQHRHANTSTVAPRAMAQARRSPRS